jgi:hypothetical protein
VKRRPRVSGAGALKTEPGEAAATAFTIDPRINRERRYNIKANFNFNMRLNCSRRPLVERQETGRERGFSTAKFRRQRRHRAKAGAIERGGKSGFG